MSLIWVSGIHCLQKLSWLIAPEKLCIFSNPYLSQTGISLSGLNLSTSWPRTKNPSANTCSYIVRRIARKEYRLEVLEWILQCLALSRSQPPVRSRRLHISLFSLPENRIHWSLELGNIIIGLTYYWIVACHEASTDVVPVLLAQVLSDLARKKGQPKKLREVEMVKKLPLVARSTRWQRTQKSIRPSFLEWREG